MCSNREMVLLDASPSINSPHISEGCKYGPVVASGFEHTFDSHALISGGGAQITWVWFLLTALCPLSTSLLSRRISCHVFSWPIPLKVKGPKKPKQQHLSEFDKPVKVDFFLTSTLLIHWNVAATSFTFELCGSQLFHVSWVHKWAFLTANIQYSEHTDKESGFIQSSADLLKAPCVGF